MPGRVPRDLKVHRIRPSLQDTAIEHKVILVPLTRRRSRSVETRVGGDASARQVTDCVIPVCNDSG